MNGYIERALNINRGKVVESDLMNERFLADIYERYYKNVYNYICFRINNHYDAEDLACTVFENAVRRFGTFKDGASAEAWLIGIAKNVVTDYMRGRKRAVTTPIPIDGMIDLVSPERLPEESVVMAENIAILMQAMGKLSAKEHQTLSLKFATGLKNVEIARLLGVSESNAGVMIHRAAGKLKKLYERAGGGVHEG